MRERERERERRERKIQEIERERERERERRIGRENGTKHLKNSTRLLIYQSKSVNVPTAP